jgi:uncharacterized protein YbcC (UPF0753/DUF2309 family)
MSIIQKVENPVTDQNIKEIIESSSNRIAPLWPLSKFVAVNPFLGFTNHHFAETSAIHKHINEVDTLLPLSWFKEKFYSGKIGMDDLRESIEMQNPLVLEAFEYHKEELEADHVVKMLEKDYSDHSDVYHVGIFSHYLDKREGSNWQRLVREEVAKFCAAYFDQGVSVWKFPWRKLDLFSAWKEFSKRDKNPELSGLRGFNQFVKEISDEPVVWIQKAINTLGIHSDQATDMLYRTLQTIPGWAGHVRYLDREEELRNRKGERLTHLLAILLSYELMFFKRSEQDEDCILGWKRSLKENPLDTGEPLITLDLAQRLVWLCALERGFERNLKSGISSKLSGKAETVRPEVQAVFCIDVRSESFRHFLEGENASIQTLGYAGFFGMPINHKVPGQKGEEARCPALLAPPVDVSSCNISNEEKHWHDEDCKCSHERNKKSVWKRYKEASASCFTFVETMGIGYVTNILKDAFALKTHKEHSSHPSILSNMSDQDKLGLAKGILGGLGIADCLAPVVLFCGHGSETKNNPYSAGLDCGACGGHAGDANARLAADLLNDPVVRKLLAAENINIPEDTTFIAGLHNTTTDEVTLFDLDCLNGPTLKRVKQLEIDLEIASKKNVKLRSAILGEGDVDTVRQRSRDWSQVRPEWGLAGNAAFVVAPRKWTQSRTWGNRVFLHEYNPQGDLEGAVLQSVMGGPLVVGSWINLQYFGSASNNNYFGSGHKGIHNVVGGIGVAIGNEYDLRPGLPFQSVHDGEKLVHEPVRLHACIAADTDLLDTLLERLPQVAELVKNEWIYLISLGKDGKQWLRKAPNGDWI